MFNFSFDSRKFMFMIIAIIVIMNVGSLLTNPEQLIGLLISVPGVLIAITFHEFAHGYAAYKLGDNTAKSQGRLSLNPLAHLDPIGTVMLLFAGFGWGKPVEVNPLNYTRKMSMEKGEAIVSIAGPLMNFVLAFIFSIIFCLIQRFVVSPAFIASTMGQLLMAMIIAAIQVNVGLGVFNLIPLPPLDGSKAIKPLLPYKVKQFFNNNEQLLYIIFIIIFITPLASMLISKPINFVYNGITKLAEMIVF